MRFEFEIYAQEQSTVVNGILNIENKLGRWSMPDNVQDYDAAKVYIQRYLDHGVTIEDKANGEYMIYPSHVILRIKIIRIP